LALTATISNQRSELSRRVSSKIIKRIQDLPEWEIENKESILIQSFLLEQLSPLHRRALQGEFFQFHLTEPPEIDGWVWMLGWLCLMSGDVFHVKLGVILGCDQWILNFQKMVHPIHLFSGSRCVDFSSIFSFYSSCLCD